MNQSSLRPCLQRLRNEPEPNTDQPNREQTVHARVNIVMYSSLGDATADNLGDIVCERGW
jgi:hypothetical protein